MYSIFITDEWPRQIGPRPPLRASRMVSLLYYGLICILVRKGKTRVFFEFDGSKYVSDVIRCFAPVGRGTYVDSILVFVDFGGITGSRWGGEDG